MVTKVRAARGWLLRLFGLFSGALGATLASVVRLILRNATRVVAAGSIGVLVSLAGLQALRPLLAVGQSTLDPFAIAGVALFLIGSGAIASLRPAKRAATVDPVVTLQSE